MRLENKVAVITGAGRGIGEAIAIRFTQEGASVVVNDIDESANKVVEKITTSDGQAIACIADITKREEAQRLMDTAVNTFGKLDILVNNAGMICRHALIQKISDERWNSVMDVNVKGVFHCLQAAAKYLRKEPVEEGRKVINFASTAGVYGALTNADYAASKGAVIALTKSIAREWARYKVNVNAVAPGAVDTRMAETMPEEMVKTTYWERRGKPEEVASLVLFLASEESNFITGQVISIDGGWIKLYGEVIKSPKRAE